MGGRAVTAAEARAERAKKHSMEGESVTGYEKREKVIEGLNAIHAVACGTGGDECYLTNIDIKQLQTLIDDATELLKAQEPTTIEERIALNKLHNIRIYAQIAEAGWMDEAAAYAETVMGLLREEIHRTQKAQTLRVLTLEEVKRLTTDDDVWIEYHELAGWAISAVTVSEIDDNGMLCRLQCLRFGFDKYGCYGGNWMAWRCWTSRPSAAQMKAEPWKEATP